MFPSFGSVRSRLELTDFDVNLIQGSTNESIRNTYSFYVQLHNRAGINLLSPSKTVAIAPGQGVAVTINNSAVEPHEEVFWVVISIGTTSNTIDAVRVAAWQARDSGQQHSRSLPVTIEFTEIEHFNLNRAVSDFASLPRTGVLPGAIAMVIESGNYYRYDPEAYDTPNGYSSYSTIVEGANNWVRYYGTTSSYLEDTQLGCDRPLNTIEHSLSLPPFNYRSIPLRIWINNGIESDGESPIVDGRYSLILRIGGIDYSNYFSEAIDYYLVGYFDREGRVLDSGIATVGEQKIWSPTSAIELPADLPRGYAAVYDLIFRIDEALSFASRLGAVGQLYLNVITVSNQTGRLSEAANYLGSLVFSDPGRLLIVPGLVRQSGLGTIKVSGSAKGFVIEAVNTQQIAGLLPNTDNQIAAISGSLNGLVRIRQNKDELEYSEKIRAYISTKSGTSNLVASPQITANNNAIAITLTQPISQGWGIIRENYSDLYLRGLTARFTPGYIYIYIKLDGSYYRTHSEIAITPDSTLTFEYKNLSDFEMVTDLPNDEDLDFSLYEPELVEVETRESGSISGQLTAYIGYYYDENNYSATKIRHDLPECINTATNSVAEIISDLGQLVDHLNNYNNPHQITTETIGATPVENFNSHEDNFANPHRVSREDLGAASQEDLKDAIAQLTNLSASKRKEVAANYTVSIADQRFIIDVNSVSSVNITLSQALVDWNEDYLFEVIIRKTGAGNVEVLIEDGTIIETGESAIAIEKYLNSTYFAYLGDKKWTIINN